eukprot:sb/3476551/
MSEDSFRDASFKKEITALMTKSGNVRYNVSDERILCEITLIPTRTGESVITVYFAGDGLRPCERSVELIDQHLASELSVLAGRVMSAADMRQSTTIQPDDIGKLLKLFSFNFELPE